ncbi:hypothetical protein [Dyadobacter luticola]|uniref:Uncharacterized protein n=1 Tax=Dyadobacter luticola TaxID=1979387 RepID=A0A5R9L6R1_9BACT|nr:hypothetical protein [Dyadobacter luticola]TLV03925.1 hypothetical protein FEN17_10165 [Dyadobacter luticola]
MTKFFCLIFIWLNVSNCVFGKILQEKPVANHTWIRISFGHRATNMITKSVRILPGSAGMQVSEVTGSMLEKNDQAGEKSLLHVGKTDVDMLNVSVNWHSPVAEKLKLASHKDQYTINNDAMWGYLMRNGSPGQSARMHDDTWNQPDAPKLTIQLAEDGTKGFSIAIEQLLRHGAMWLPEHDCYITLTEKPVDFQQHLATLTGKRTLDLVNSSPDASLKEFKNKWEDFGNPLAWNVSWQTRYLGTTGHLVVTAAAHGSIYKFAIDRFANVRPDFASPHQFKLDFSWPESQWKSQRILNGLPILKTQFEKKGQHLETEQFAAPLTKLPQDGGGEIPSVLLAKMRFSGKPGPVSFGLKIAGVKNGVTLEAKQSGDHWNVVEAGTHAIWLSVNTSSGFSVKTAKLVNDLDSSITVQLTFNGELNATNAKEILVKLPSPTVAAADSNLLENVDFLAKRKSVADYWENRLNQGAHFEVPEEAVNELFRANLWHALILPRHRKDEKGKLHMDLPYANTAYGQKNADWPVNQAVYVDYMLYGLRGHQAMADAEISAMFDSQQQPDGRIGGFANWAVYSPGHLYAIGKNYLLSHDREQFNRLLPQSLKTADWCLAQLVNAKKANAASGLIRGPLNDLTHADREWAFSQAYFVAGLEVFGQALAVHGHPRAKEMLTAAAQLKIDVEKAFSKSSVKSAAVQLADGTWNNFVPTDAMINRRLMDQWYPSDVDCGPLHLARLNAIDPRGWLTTAMLHDHEDNLFLKNQGAANEPIYVQQATAYLLRDEPKAAIRAFYSLMASGFSHNQLSPLEHRWAWGQYYGPPSTDGAWFELYRNMLIHETDSTTLMLGQAVPRKWLENGQEIKVKNAPTNFGNVSYSIKSQANAGTITAEIALSNRNPPENLVIRFRHPKKKLIKSVLVNGQVWKDFDVKKEWVKMIKPTAGSYRIVAKY